MMIKEKNNIKDLFSPMGLPTPYRIKYIFI